MCACVCLYIYVRARAGGLAKDTNKSSTTQTAASSNHDMLALMLSHSVVLTSMLQIWEYSKKLIKNYEKVEIGR